MTRRILALLLCAAMLLSLFGCTQDAAQPTEPTVPPTTEPPVANLYLEAAAPIQKAQDLELEITVTKQMTVGGETFTLDSEQDLTLSGIGTENLQVSLTETLAMDGADDKYEEYFSGGTLYTTVYDTYKYKGDMTEAEYLSRFAPAIMLTDSLYSDITAAKDGENTLLIFATPTAGESWALPEGAVFADAQGSALIDATGTLMESTYTIDYILGGMEITETYHSVPTLPETVALTAPEDESEYIQLACIDAPRLYDQALLYLYSSEAVTSNITETIVSQAAALVRTQQTTLNFHGAGSSHMSDVTININALQSGEASTYSQKEHFQDGTYSITVDGGEPEESTDLSTRDMFVYCQEYLSENIVALDYVTSAEASEIGGILYLEFDYSADMGDVLKAYACSILFDDEALLDDLCTEYIPGDVNGYMALDPATGFPTAVGMTYSGTHTIEEEDYILTLQTDQSFYVASQSAYETISGETPSESVPDSQPTPLFYHVTGTDGQEMWLLGTIHAGDERTSIMPQAIYNALSESDALAVEFDTIAFEEALTTDPDLMAQIAACYFYTDGTTTKDHLDAETYEAAIKLLKASGNYNANAELMKPSLWEQTITNFFIQQSYGIQYDKGVDMRLLKLAKQRGLEIRDIESGIDQMKMMTGYSDELQQYMLSSTIETGIAGYYSSTAELYEQWCQGDEAVLREAVLEDLSEMSEEEMALYEEYVKAMLTDRNAGMLQAAIDYLESGDTVFYAVGLAHLLAGNGLVDTLREAGYTVEQVSYR